MLEEGQKGERLIPIACAFMIGYTGSILQCFFTAMVFQFSHVEISIYNSGLAFSGVLTTLLAMLELTFVEEKDVITQA